MTLALLLFALAPPAAAVEAPRTAGAVVMSDEWIIRKEKGEEEFKGNVRLDQGPDALRAGWALYDKGRGLWKARGDVRATRTDDQGGTAEVQGDEGSYRLADRSGELTGRPLRFSRSFKDEAGAGHRWDGSAAKAAYDGKAATLRLSGGVHLRGDGMELRSKEAFYERAAGRVTFTEGRPVARVERERFSGALQAVSLTVADSPRRLRAEGGVRGWLHFHPPKR